MAPSRDAGLDQLLEAIKAAGGIRRSARLRRWSVALGLLSVAIVVSTVVALVRQDRGGEQVETSGVASSPATDLPESCRDSVDPACGPFHWDPDPGSNAPLLVTVTPSTETPKAGDEVVFTVTWSDDDASQLVGSEMGFENETELGLGYFYTACVPELCPYGAWSPPVHEPGSGTTTFSHTYTTAGTFRVSYLFFSGTGWDRFTRGVHNPYSSAASGSLTIEVQPS